MRPSEQCAGRFHFLPPAFAAAWVLLCFSRLAWAGPPFLTDDPEPVELHHWEVYLASQYFNDRDGVTATLPHVEVNYGAVPDVQLHVIAPMEFVHPAGDHIQYGYGDTELGVKYRFIHESAWVPQVGMFPLVEVPTGDAKLGLGNGKPQYFIPIWLQKSFGPWTTYGGAGYWFNLGHGNRDWMFAGWEVQRQITDHLTLGGEVFYQTPDTIGGQYATGFNLGTIIDFTDNYHLLLSAGRDFVGTNRFMSYAAFQWTF